MVGLSNEQELKTYGTDPRIHDTDGDGYGDGSEVMLRSDPLDASSTPAVAIGAAAGIPSAIGIVIGIGAVAAYLRRRVRGRPFSFKKR